MFLIGSVVPWRRNIFLDGGGNNGCSVRRFRKEFDPLCRFMVYTFEPNEVFAGSYVGLPRHTLIRAALDAEDGVRRLFIDRDDGDGSTFFQNKLTAANGGFGTLDLDSPIETTTVGLSRWVRENVRKRDYLVLKLDVEGAEYDILEKMILDGTARQIRHLFVEWHWRKIGVPEKRHERLIATLNEIGIPIVEWDAQGY